MMQPPANNVATLYFSIALVAGSLVRESHTSQHCTAFVLVNMRWQSLLASQYFHTADNHLFGGKTSAHSAIKIE